MFLPMDRNRTDGPSPSAKASSMLPFAMLSSFVITGPVRLVRQGSAYTPAQVSGHRNIAGLYWALILPQR